VRFWKAEDGWGVIDSSDTPGGCWAHFSHLVGFGHTPAGQEVTFDFEAAAQDGYRFRATEVRPEGGVPDWPTVVVTGPSDAYRSTLTLEFDDPDEAGTP
jgi:CspA family cold shock protein